MKAHYVISYVLMLSARYIALCQDKACKNLPCSLFCQGHWKYWRKQVWQIWFSGFFIYEMLVLLLEHDVYFVTSYTCITFWTCRCEGKPGMRRISKFYRALVTGIIENNEVKFFIKNTYYSWMAQWLQKHKQNHKGFFHWSIN